MDSLLKREVGPSKDWGLEKETKLYLRFLIEKVFFLLKKSDLFYSFTCFPLQKKSTHKG